MTRDGRHVDPDLGALLGEGSLQEVREREEGLEEIAAAAFDRVPAEQDLRDATYYDRPVLKAPVWKWFIPAYFVAGGAAGAAAALGAAAQILGASSMHRLVRRCRGVAAGGTVLGTVFLVLDLGRPSRFANMLRVFRPTSPMSVGSWILAPATGAAVASLLPGPLGSVAGLGAGVLGPPLASYTAALTSTTAVPLWQQTRRTLPALYASSAVASAAGVLELSGLVGAEARVVTIFGGAGRVAELASGFATDRDASGVERVARPLHEGVSGAVWRASKLVTMASLVFTVLGLRRPALRRAAGLLGLLGSIAAKFAIFQAGIASARDPRATFEQQRAGYGGAEVSPPAG